MITVKDRYRLECHWDTVVYEQAGRCKLGGAFFSGPVMSITNKIESNDKIQIDFFSQYLWLVKSVYVATLSWGEVSYTHDGRVAKLSDCFITHDSELNTVPQLKDTDWLLIDTINHEDMKHAFNLVYRTYVIHEDKDIYTFNNLVYN